MSYLFQCAVGPVQDFIATARKSRDLWYGSWLLSELAKAAAKAIAEGGGGLVFPAPTANLTPKSRFNAPNKIVAIVSGEPGRVGKAVEAAIRQRLDELRVDAFKRVGAKGLFKEGLAKAQVEDLPEFYWVGVEFDGSDAGYVRARNTAERTMSARKTTRDFEKSNGDYLPKSSLDGVRESVIDEGAYPVPGARATEKARKAKAIYDHFGARPAERLSGVDILKRLGLRGKSETQFHSTSHMAALPFLALVDRRFAAGKQQKGNREQLLAEIRELLEDLPQASDEDDGALVFSSRLAEWIPDGAELREKQNRLDKLIEEYAEKTRPSPYFALLLADGDGMGEAIDHQTTPQAHQALSQALSQFADEVDGIVKKYHGQLIYSGGDDVMAYLPLHTVVACVQELAVKFASRMEDFKKSGGGSPTLSAGIVVAHHLEPLQDTLELARAAERTAKSVPGKHALAITVSKRSGVDRTIKGKREDVMERLTTMIGWRRAGDISAGTPYELQKLHQVLGGSPALKDAMIKEALRIVERKRESGGASMSKEKQNVILDEFRKWLDEVSLLKVSHEMIIANEFASAMDMACGENKECEPS